MCFLFILVMFLNVDDVILGCVYCVCECLRMCVFGKFLECS